MPYIEEEVQDLTRRVKYHSEVVDRLLERLSMIEEHLGVSTFARTPEQGVESRAPE